MIINTCRRVSILSAIFIGLVAIAANAKTFKDTPVPADKQCDYVNFHHNEAKNIGGKAKCTSDCDCDGMRSCVSGKCSGIARPKTLSKEVCDNKDYHYNEAWTAAGEMRATAGSCSGDCECDGLRTCVSGECTGSAR
jgi:hypothetical protein